MQSNKTLEQSVKTGNLRTFANDQDTWTINQNRNAALSMHLNKTPEQSIETGKLCKYANYQTLDRSIKTGKMCLGKYAIEQGI